MENSSRSRGGTALQELSVNKVPRANNSNKAPLRSAEATAGGNSSCAVAAAAGAGGGAAHADELLARLREQLRVSNDNVTSAAKFGLQVGTIIQISDGRRNMCVCVERTKL